MIVILLIVALIVVLASLLVGAGRRRRMRRRQNELPFPVHPEPLEDDGLLVRIGRRGRADGYAPTAVGEAMMRVWLSAPRGGASATDISLDALFGDGIDEASLRLRQREGHQGRLSEYERVEALLSGYPEWRIGLEAARMGMRFERSCLAFWDPAPDAERHPRGTAALTAASS